MLSAHPTDDSLSVATLHAISDSNEAGVSKYHLLVLVDVHLKNLLLESLHFFLGLTMHIRGKLYKWTEIDCFSVERFEKKEGQSMAYMTFCYV